MTDRKFTILVVDDDADARLVMRAALRKAGFEVRLAEGGHDGLRQFRVAPCDMVMLDVDMPDLGGHEVCAVLRAEVGPMLPIVMVTGMDDVGSVEMAYEHGATDFISKPVNWALVGHRVRYLFRSLQTMMELRAAEARNAAVLNAIPDPLFELDVEGRYIDYRAPHDGLLVAPPAELLGKTVAEVLPPAAADACMGALRNALRDGFSSGAQFELQLGQGSTWFELSVSRKAIMPGETPRFIVLSRDITERKEAEARIERLAYFDSLTGLPNRHALLTRLKQLCGEPSSFALLFVDLDRFKAINDTRGHGFGDEVLAAVARRIESQLTDYDFAARLGGDEFALILGASGEAAASSFAARLLAALGEPQRVGGETIIVTPSIGVAMYPAHAQEPAELLRFADLAMYAAKRTNRNAWKLHSTEQAQADVSRYEFEQQLRRALDGRQFALVYQPRFDASGSCVLGAEALLRWHHPERGVVSPADFIPVLEETGLIEPVGRWVIDEALSQLAVWEAAGASGFTLSVNVSACQLRSDELVRWLEASLPTKQVRANAFELELTESVLLEDSERGRSYTERIRALGIRISIDDFGTGYSSLGYLKRFAPDVLKIDRSLVRDIDSDPVDRALVQGTISIAHSLGVQVVAEGVERIEQRELLEQMGCDELQGFLLGRPTTAKQIEQLAGWAVTAT